MFKVKKDYESLMSGVKDIKRDYGYKDKLQEDLQTKLLLVNTMVLIVCLLAVGGGLIVNDILSYYNIGGLLWFLAVISAILITGGFFLKFSISLLDMWFRRDDRITMFKDYLMYNTLLEHKETGEVLMMYELWNDENNTFKYLNEYKGTDFSISELYRTVLKDYRVLDASLGMYLNLDSQGLYKGINSYIDDTKFLEERYRAIKGRDKVLSDINKGMELKEKDNKIQGYIVSKKGNV